MITVIGIPPEMKFILDKFTKLKKLTIDKATYVHGDLFKNLINLEHLTLKIINFMQ